MKRLLILPVLFIFIILPLCGQDNNGGSDGSDNSKPGSGFVNITEVSGSSFGLRHTGSPNENYYFGVTNIIGYQIDKHFLAGAGIGYMAYDSSTLVPLFLELRYTTCFKRINPWLFYDSGFLIDFNNVADGSQLFINPGVGLSLSFSPRIEVTMGTGLMMQMQPGHRTSFINFKLGMIFRKNSRCR
jgi:hypothetical protein